jgi:1,2-phenylacetyl-CoA epoxidase PaaB subunit
MSVTKIDGWETFVEDYEVIVERSQTVTYRFDDILSATRFAQALMARADSEYRPANIVEIWCNSHMIQSYSRKLHARSE